MLPNFIVIGAGKAGTTSLWAYLGEHPQVFMSEPKELDFFTTEHNWHRGLPWYEEHFAGAGGAVAIGEASGNYANWPSFAGVPERMSSVLPDARLLYVIRHPVDRIVSAYRHRRVHGTEHLPIEQAVLTEPMYLNVSRYSSQIEQYLEHYSRDRLHVIVSEEMRSDRAATMARVFEFLGLDPVDEAVGFATEFNQTDHKIRQARSLVRRARDLPGFDVVARHTPAPVWDLAKRFGTKAALQPEEAVLSDPLRTQLEDLLRDDVARLRTHLGSDFHCWGLT